MTTIDRHGPRAVYHQIHDLLAREIAERLRPGDRIPAEHELAARFAVNRHTLRHAVDALIADGLLERRRGLGTFVLDRPVAYPLHGQARFTENVEAAGKAHDSRIVHRAAVPAEAAVAQALGLRVGDTVWWLETVRLVDGRPFTVISHFLPVTPFPDLLAVYDGGSLHAVLTTRYGVRLRRASTLVTAAPPAPEDASLLLIPRSQPVLRLKTVNVDAARGTVCEYALSRARGDRIELHVELG